MQCKESQVKKAKLETAQLDSQSQEVRQDKDGDGAVSWGFSSNH